MPDTSRKVYGLAPSATDDYQSLRLDVIRRRWDTKAQRWDTDLADESCHLNEDGAYARFLETARGIVDQRADFCCRHLLVDVGCGTGLVLASLLGYFAEGLGLDISARMLAVARQRGLPRARFAEGNCFELGQCVQQAGAIVSRGILLSHYGTRWAGVLLGQVHAVVGEGGFALLDFLNASCREQFAERPENKTYFTAEEMAALTMEAGFAHFHILGEPWHRVRMLLLER